MFEEVHQVVSILPHLLGQRFLLGPHHRSGQGLLLRYRAALVATVVGEQIVQRAASGDRKEIRVTRRRGQTLDTAHVSAHRRIVVVELIVIIVVKVQIGVRLLSLDGIFESDIYIVVVFVFRRVVRPDAHHRSVQRGAVGTLHPFLCMIRLHFHAHGTGQEGFFLVAHAGGATRSAGAGRRDASATAATAVATGWPAASTTASATGPASTGLAIRWRHKHTRGERLLFTHTAQLFVIVVIWRQFLLLHLLRRVILKVGCVVQRLLFIPQKCIVLVFC